ncbi:MAG: sigma-70 family RNA polymerase sigma factor [Clostridia bacterium]|nr:sigma-70 family RNA polymerase sigma factor [Clostridia bacterium]
MVREKAERGYEENLFLIEQTRQGSEREREEATAELIRRNTGLLRSIALRFCDRGVDFEDLLQIGTIGMIKAIRSFDLSRGTCFSTYAVPLIFGEIRRHMRDEGPIKVGRGYKRLGTALLNARNRILSEEGREASISELAALCEVSPEEAAMALDAMSPVVSLSDRAYGEEEGVEIGSLIPDEEASGEIERLSDRIALGQAIAKMPENWRNILTLRYYRNMTQQQVAERLRLSQVKVSREEKKILEFLRGELT